LVVFNAHACVCFGDKGWIRLQNGYYLPLQSDDGKVKFLHKVSSRAQPSNTELKRIGSSTPLFRTKSVEKDTVASLLDGPLSMEGVEASATTGIAERPLEIEAAPLTEIDESKETLRAAIHMDAMVSPNCPYIFATTCYVQYLKHYFHVTSNAPQKAFGMGCCCLQITFQAKDIEESRFIYDQLAVLTPIMMALTAATPLLKGRIADTDCRWGIISESVDCRTPAERGREDPKAPYDYLTAGGMRRIHKSRYDSISTYIYQGALYLEDEQDDMKKSGLANRVLNIYNDIPVPIDESSYQQLREAGVDPALAQHIAHLFIRDPLVVFEGAVEELDDETMTEHFESIQSTNWYVLAVHCVPSRYFQQYINFLLPLSCTGKQYAGSLRLLEIAQTILIVAGELSFGPWKFS